MKILVFSDSHGNKGNMVSVLQRNPDASLIIHLGDGANDILELQKRYPAVKVHVIQGNCDRPGSYPAEEVLDIEGIRIMICHGHTYGVKYSLTALVARGISEKANVILYGHTHEASIDRSDGITLVCPGSIWRPRTFGSPTYAVVEVNDGRFQVRNHDFRI